MATIKDIAEKTGLGLATVSSYLNGGNVREKNRIKIEAAISELHYEVNETARCLKTNRTKMIGAVIPELESNFCAQLLSRIEDQLRHHGYGMLVCDCRTDKDREKEAIDFLLRRRVDGLFNMPVDISGEHLKKFRRTGRPIVLLDRQIPEADYDYVCVNNREAFEGAVRILVQNGHRRIGMIAGPQEIPVARERLAGFMAACRENGLSVPDGYIYPGEDTMESGVKGIEHLLQAHPEITGVVISNYQMSVGTVIGLNEMGKKFPDDLSVIGFDNPHFARACSPKLTIISQPVKEMGNRAAEIMLKRLEEKKAGNLSAPEHIWMDAVLLPGKSVRRADL